MENKKVVEIRDVCFSYGTHKVLKGVNASIEEGKITTLMGANGCGKSTLFSVLTKIRNPEQGEITLYGRNISEFDLKAFAKKVAIVQQYNSAPSDITVEKLVSLGRTPYRKCFGCLTKKDREKIEQAMKETHITHLRNREVSRLSGGQRQRVWIAMALAQDTKVLFLDEPTTYLDIRYQIEILELIKRLNEKYGITIIMVLHDINQAIRYSDSIIGLKDGRVLAEGKPGDVISEKMLEVLYDIHLSVKELEGKKIVINA